MKKKYNIIIPHKCGSTITHKMLIAATQLVGNSYINTDRPAQQWNVQNLEHQILFGRIPQAGMLDNYDWSDVNTDRYLFVIRHPLSRLISEYYSFGWTHNIDARHIKDDNSRRVERAENSKLREKIQSTSLEDYIIEKLGSCTIDKFIARCLDRGESYCTLILPYELLIVRSDEYVNKCFEFVGLGEASEAILSEFKEQFVPVEDRTASIVNDGLKTHRRTSDIHEWREKLDLQYIHDKTNSMHVDYLDNYKQFLTKHDIN